MADNSTTPPPYGGPQSGLSGRGTRFFDWMRSIGVTRTDGWVGGVCAGVAYRIGIDPLIVRGIVVVAALLGAPLLLVYALAWALLPDRDGRIHLQRLFDGDFEPPMVAIGVLLVLSLLPWTNGTRWIGGPFWHDSGWGDIVGRVFWTLLVLGAAATLIVIAVRNANARRNDGTGAPQAPTPTDPYASPASATDTLGAAGSAGTTIAQAAAGEPATASPAEPVGSPTLDIGAEPAAPPAPAVGATEQDVADWRARQAQWQSDHAQWKQRLAEDMRAVKAQRSAELRAQASAATAEADARRLAYRAANPRVGAAIGWLIFGLALVAGALTSAFWGPATGLPGYALTASLAAATLVFGAGVLIAGLARRRSGFLIFFGILLAVLTGLAALLPTTPPAALNASITDGRDLDVAPAGSANYIQGWGQTTIDLDAAVTADGTPVVNLAKGAGATRIVIPEEATVRVEATTTEPLLVTDPDGSTRAHACDPGWLGACHTSILVGPAGPADAIVRVAQVDEVVVDRVEK